MNSSQGVVILGNEYQALGHLRCLASEGVQCVLIDQKKQGPALFSKYRKEFFVSPEYSSSDFWPWLKNLAARNGYTGWLIIPTDDEQVRELSQNYHDVSATFRNYIAPWESYQILYDKRLAYRWAQKIGIHQPRSFLPTDRSVLTGHDLEFPFILKPAIKRDFKKYSNKKAIRVNTNEELNQLVFGQLRDVPIEDLICQEIIPGGGENQWSYAGFFVQGEPVAAYTACRMRQHPPVYGRASTYVVALHDKEVEETGRRIVRELNYTGLAEVEFKRDPRHGRLNFLEVNARSWGWHSLSTEVVGNLTKMIFDHAYSGKYTCVAPKYGARWVKWITDVPVVLHLMTTGRLGLMEYLKSIRDPITSCEYDFDDPKPFFFQMFVLPALILERGY